VKHAIRPLDPATYARHRLHEGERIWPESNCYVDLWIELLHTARLEPVAALPFTLTIDVEGDQWTFFKFPLADLYDLYGIDVIELNVWRPLLDHVGDQLAQRRPTIVEVDAFYLPDTTGTSYRTEHVKTSIAIQALDCERHRLRYFHNAAYYELEGLDFVDLFRLDGDTAGPTQLPPYVEVVKFSARTPLAGPELVAASRDLLRRYLSRRPEGNPFRRYKRQFSSDLDNLAGGSLTRFHGYAFATVRQCGAAFELAGAYMRWLEANREGDLARVAVACEDIATNAKALQFKAARAVNTGRSFDPSPTLDAMADRWDQVMSALDAMYGALAHQG
jgi:hypothetical protein